MKLGDRCLIEDYLPLDALNATASKEKVHPRHYVLQTVSELAIGRT